MKHQPPGWKSHWLEKALKDSSAGICLLDSDGRVRYQNTPSLRHCGSYKDAVCPKECLLSKDNSLSQRSEGLHFYPNHKIGNQYYDMAFLDSWHTRVIVQYPLRRRYEKQLHQFMTNGLSPREMDVVQLGLKGQTNEEIAVNLGISKATLKTHLNNIYKKIPEVRGKNWRGVSDLSYEKNGDTETS